LNSIDYSISGLTARECVKIRIRDPDELKQRLRTEWAKLDHIVIAAAIVSGVVDSSRSVMSVLHTFCCNISHILLSNLIVPRLQNKVQQRIAIKTTEMVDNGNTRKANTTRVSQHRMPDYKNML